jgi:hypothetical protein
VKWALAVAALLPVGLVLACGSSGLSQDDPRWTAISSMVALAADSYNSQGGSGLYAYAGNEVRRVCDREQFATAVEDQPRGPLQSIEEITVDGDVATVQLTLNTLSGPAEAEWTLSVQPNSTWAVIAVPGSEACR